MEEKQIMENEAVEQLDKAVAEAVEAAKLKWEQETAVKLAAARAEGERMAGMSVEEKLLERERQLDKREKDMQRKELRARMELELVEKGLPRELAQALDYEGEDEAKESLIKLEKVFREAVQARVSEKLGSMEPPRAGHAVDNMHLTDEQYYVMRMGAKLI